MLLISPNFEMNIEAYVKSVKCANDNIYYVYHVKISRKKFEKITNSDFSMKSTR